MKKTSTAQILSAVAILMTLSLGVAVPTASAATSDPAVGKAFPATKGKVGKSYSKATLNALQPLPRSADFPQPTAVNSAASIALSPVVNKNAVRALSGQTPVLPSDTSGLAIVAAPAAPVYDEESSLNQHERLTEAVTDSDALGQESVSVVDRFADKPKARPISEGSLRVKMKDSGVRASVQIPLTQALR